MHAPGAYVRVCLRLNLLLTPAPVSGGSVCGGGGGCLWLAFLFRFVGALCIVCVCAGGAFVCVCVRACVRACVRLCASIIGDSVRLCVCVLVAAIAWWWRPLYALLFVCVYA